jgi:hypothetical protein
MRAQPSIYCHRQPRLPLQNENRGTPTCRQPNVAMKLSLSRVKCREIIRVVLTDEAYDAIASALPEGAARWSTQRDRHCTSSAGERYGAEGHECGFRDNRLGPCRPKAQPFTQMPQASAIEL